MPVDTSVEVPLGIAARLRFSRIREQMMLCTTRVEAAMSPLYSGYVDRYQVRDHKVWGPAYRCQRKNEDRRKSQS